MKSSQYFTRLNAVALVVPMLLSMPVLGADMTSDDVFVNSGDVKWQDAPPSLPKGGKVAVLYGDPGKAGPFVMRLKAPAGYKIAPHWHPQAENLTVISGTLFLGRDDTLDASQAHGLKTGGFHYLPAKAHHYAFTKAPTIVQIHGDGPFDITYIDPADNPEK